MSDRLSPFPTIDDTSFVTEEYIHGAAPFPPEAPDTPPAAKADSEVFRRGGF